MNCLHPQNLSTLKNGLYGSRSTYNFVSVTTKIIQSVYLTTKIANKTEVKMHESMRIEILAS